MRLLIEANVQTLERLSATLETIGSDLWLRAVAGGSLRIGSHVRHLLDFYTCFFAGLEYGEIDYDARSRDRTIESSRVAAMHALRFVIEDLQALTRLDPETTVSVREGDSVLRSTVGREMSCLLHHTIHHMALIDVALRSHGVPVDPAFGVAPATLRYRQRRGAAA